MRVQANTLLKWILYLALSILVVGLLAQPANAQCFENPTGQTTIVLKNASSHFLTLYIDGVGKGGVASNDHSADFVVSSGDHVLMAEAFIGGELVSASRLITIRPGDVCVWTVTDPYPTTEVSNPERPLDLAPRAVVPVALLDL